MEKIEPYNNLTIPLIKKIAKGDIFCIISALSLTELLSRPYVSKDYSKIKLFKEFISSLPNSAIQNVTYDIACFAANIRADYNLRTPDAILISTAFITKSGYFITNDISLKKIILKDLQIIVMDDYLHL